MILISDSTNRPVEQVQASRSPATSTRESESGWDRGMTEVSSEGVSEKTMLPLRKRAEILSLDRWGLLMPQSWTQMARTSLLKVP